MFRFISVLLFLSFSQPECDYVESDTILPYILYTSLYNSAIEEFRLKDSISGLDVLCVYDSGHDTHNFSYEEIFKKDYKEYNQLESLLEQMDISSIFIKCNDVIPICQRGIYIKRDGALVFKYEGVNDNLDELQNRNAIAFQLIVLIDDLIEK